MISRQQYQHAGKENDLEITVSVGRKGKLFQDNSISRQERK
jgi:hypothetical protein